MVAKNFWQKQKLLTPRYIRKPDLNSDGFIGFEGIRVLILTQEILKNKTTDKPLSIDYLIIGNKLKPKIKQILECVSPRKIIVDKSKLHVLLL